MSRKSFSLRGIAVLGWVLGIALATPAPSVAQSTAGAPVDSVAPPGATLRRWDENGWLTIFDRAGAYFGRVSDRGILQRFNELMDFEYHIDVLSYTPGLSETRDWYARDDGARAWGGSLNHLKLLAEGHFKVAVPLGETWATDIRYVRQETLEAQRSLLWIRFAHDMLDERLRAFFRSTLAFDKSEIDFELGLVWRTGPGEVSASFGALDLFSDVIFQRLEIGARIAPLALDYTSKPYTAHLTADLPLSRHFRFEAYALALTPTEVIVESQTRADSGFVQQERYAYAGGLLEWTPSPSTALGVYGTWVRARLGRSPLPAGAPADEFDLREKTWQAGLYGLDRLSRRFALEIWIQRLWRSEERRRPETATAPEIDYEDRSWGGRATLTYRAPGGFRADAGFDILERDIVKEDAVPGLGALRRDNSRLRFSAGWRFGRRALFLLGFNRDLDDSDGRGFDGAFGRFALYW